MFRAKINTLAPDFLDFGSLHNKARWKDWCKNNNGVEISIGRIKNVPSEELRGYYYGAIIPTVKSVVKEWNTLDEDDIHEVLKKLFNYFDFYNPLTKRIERVGRSAMSGNSNTVRAMEFIEKIRVWLAEEFLTELPDPNEYKKKMDEVVML